MLSLRLRLARRVSISIPGVIMLYIGIFLQIRSTSSSGKVGYIATRGMQYEKTLQRGLVFGQPRQEDLLLYLAEQDEIVGTVASESMISLEPPVTSTKRYKKTAP